MATKSTKFMKLDSIKLRLAPQKEELGQFLADKLLKLSEKHAQEKGPGDLSEKHDKYLYGK